MLHVRLIHGRGHSLDLVDRARRALAGRAGVWPPGDRESGEYEPVVEVGRKVTVVGLRDGAVVEVVPTEWPCRRSVFKTMERG